PRNNARYFVNHSNNNSKSSSEDIASERGFVFFLLSAALVAEAPLTPFRGLGDMMFTVQINRIHYDFPAFYTCLTIKPTRQQNAILSLFTRKSHAQHACLRLTYRLSRSNDTSVHVCRAPVTRHLVAVTCSSCVSPTLVMCQSYGILSLATRQMCPPRPRTLEIERLESSENVDQNVMV